MSEAVIKLSETIGLVKALHSSARTLTMAYYPNLKEDSAEFRIQTSVFFKALVELVKK